MDKKIVRVGDWEIISPKNIGISFYGSDGSTIIEPVNLEGNGEALEVIVLRGSGIRKIWGISQLKNIGIKIDNQNKQILIKPKGCKKL